MVNSANTDSEDDTMSAGPSVTILLLVIGIDEISKLLDITVTSD